MDLKYKTSEPSSQCTILIKENHRMSVSGTWEIGATSIRSLHTNLSNFYSSTYKSMCISARFSAQLLL